VRTGLLGSADLDILLLECEFIGNARGDLLLRPHLDKGCNQIGECLIHLLSRLEVIKAHSNL
jgi:hypothetical protein